MRTIILILSAFWLLSNVLFAQSVQVSFGYDTNGNRISKTIILGTVIHQVNNNTDSTLINNNETSHAKQLADSKKFNNDIYNDNVDKAEIEIAPNPTTGTLLITVKNIYENISGNLIVYDLNGKIVFSKSNIENSNFINISHCMSGTYILNISINGTLSKWKILKI